MKRSTQNMLYHLVPVAVWSLALIGALVPVVLNRSSFNLQLSTSYYWGFPVSGIVLACLFLIGRIKRHTTSVEECFQVAVLLGVASYWLPTVVLLIFPIWGYLIYQNLFSFRSFAATMIGFAAVAIWMTVLHILSVIHYPLDDIENTWGWIPTGAFLFAYIASTTARRILRVR